MTTDPTTAPVTITRYGVIAAGADLTEAAGWCPYTSATDAADQRRRLDRKLPERAPHRIVRIDMELTEEGDTR